MTPIDRYPRYLVAKYIAWIAGMDVDSFHYHQRQGHIPPPRHPLYEGCQEKELFYNGEEVQDIVRFFLEREFWERVEKKENLE